VGNRAIGTGGCGLFDGVFIPLARGIGAGQFSPLDKQGYRGKVGELHRNYPT